DRDRDHQQGRGAGERLAAQGQELVAEQEDEVAGTQEGGDGDEADRDGRRVHELLEAAYRCGQREQDERPGEHRLRPVAAPVPLDDGADGQDDEAEGRKVLSYLDRDVQEAGVAPPPDRACSIHCGIERETDSGVTRDLTRYSTAPSDMPCSIIEGSP